MVSRGEKLTIVTIGVILICLGFIAFFYYEEVLLFEVHPYREYGFPLGIAGLIVLLIGIILPVSISKRTRTPIRTQYCRKCGQRIIPGSLHCGHCGQKLE